jgi:predicted O-methyltransferase YrrM
MFKTFTRNLLRVLDVLLLPFTCLALLWLRAFRFGGPRRMPLTRRACLRVGVWPLRDHFYDPQFHPRHLPPGYDRRERALPGLDLDVPGQLARLAELDSADELRALASDGAASSARLDATNFGAGDSEYLYSMVRRFKPRRVLEIGSGNSSLVSLAALDRNAAEDPARGGELVCIDPRAPAHLDSTRARVVRKRVEELGVPFFSELARDDLLFIDSAHVVRPQGDVLFEYLELLPSLRSGVHVHVHDVYTPRDYPAALLVGRHSFWNEQYLLEALLCGNRGFRVTGALNHLWHHHFEALAAKCPLLKSHPGKQPGSFWIESV